MIKVLKLMKNQSFLNKASEHLKISSGSERLISFSVGFTLFIHISSCLYIFLGQLTKTSYPAWTEGAIEDTEDDLDLYILSFYFVVTTVTTVGYGDYSPDNRYERIFCMFLMVIGVSSFTFVSGALSSIMSNYDQGQAELQEQFLHLNRLRGLYNIPSELH